MIQSLDLTSGLLAPSDPMIDYSLYNIAFHLFLIFKRMFPLEDIVTQGVSALTYCLSAYLRSVLQPIF